MCRLTPPPRLPSPAGLFDDDDTRRRPMTDHDWLELLVVLLAFLAQRLSR